MVERSKTRHSSCRLETGKGSNPFGDNNFFHLFEIIISSLNFILIIYLKDSEVFRYGRFQLRHKERRLFQSAVVPKKLNTGRGCSAFETYKTKG